MTKTIINSVLFLFLFSCGGDSHNNDAFDEREDENPEPEALQSAYRGDLKPVNLKSVKRVEGQVFIRLKEDQFEVNMGVQNVPSAVHAQHFHTGKNCPTAENDTNQDGVLDRSEVEAVSGPVFIPLDGDLDNNSEDSRSYPDGGFLKAYGYKEETSRSRLLAELGLGQSFNLENRVVLIFGTDDDANLPIACAELTKVIGSRSP